MAGSLEALGRQVARRAEDQPLGTPGRRDEVRDAEIRHLDRAVAPQQHVGRLDVAVHDVVRMSRREAAGDGRAQRPGLLRTQPAAAQQQMLEARPLHVLQGQKRAGGRILHVEDGDHVGVAGARRRDRLAHQLGDELLALLGRRSTPRRTVFKATGRCSLGSQPRKTVPMPPRGDELDHLVTAEEHVAQGLALGDAAPQGVEAAAQVVDLVAGGLGGAGLRQLALRLGELADGPHHRHQAAARSAAMSSRAEPRATADAAAAPPTASATRAGCRESTNQSVPGTGALAPSTSAPRRSGYRPAPRTWPERAMATSAGGKAASGRRRATAGRSGRPGGARPPASARRDAAPRRAASLHRSGARPPHPGQRRRDPHHGAAPARMETGSGQGAASPASARRRDCASLSCTRITVSPRKLTTATASTPREDHA